MLAPSKNGIICDKCGKQYNSIFIYYSFDFNKYYITNNTLPRIIYTQQSEISLDICDPCFSEISQIVIKNYKPTKPTSIGGVTTYQGGMYCELTNKHMIGTYEAYLCNISKINVDVKNKNKFIEKRFLELWIHPDTLKQFVQKAESVRSQTKNQWTTESS